ARSAAAAGVAVAAALAVPPAARLLAPPSIELHLIDVGQGDAIAIRTPAGRWVLVDAGPRSDSFDAGRALVAPYLLRHGARELEALILTHPDADHVGGAGAVVRMLDPGVVLDPARPTGKAPYLDAVRAAEAAGSRWARAARGAELHVDGVDLLVLAPDSSVLAAASGANDISAVVLVRYGLFRALLMGDAPAEVELRLIARDPAALRAAVLKVGHHGSHTSTTAELLEVVRPRIALVPVGRRNRYGHPHPVVMERLRVAGATVARTDRHGSVVVRARPDGGARIVQPPLR
ncbi:MAG: ComEC/Rec2 family competence protein, partial [Gemmatimonadota bacterium]